MEYVTDAQFDRSEPSLRQTATWTCSAMALSWLNRAMGIDRATDEWSAVSLIGRPQHINPEWGLMDGSGERLAQLLREDRGAAYTTWVDFPTLSELVAENAVLLGGAGWYHWVGVRDYSATGLSIANSAPGWGGVDQVLTAEQFRALGPFAAVVVPLHIEFPPPTDE